MARPVRRGGRRDERGVVAVIVALTSVALFVAAAVVIDFGGVRADRQVSKLAADDAVAAGMRGADKGTSDVYTDSAVCAALNFLKANRTSLSGLPAGICASPSATKVCVPGDSTTFSSYTGTTTSGGSTYQVWIKMPYSVSDTSTDGGFSEESLSSLASDTGDSSQQGCDQIGVVIKQSSPPGLGKIVFSGNLQWRVRSVGRVTIGSGDRAPALLLLERTKCSVLTVGSGGSPSRIRVYGSGTTPATIHSDSDATGADCGSGSNQQLIQGKQSDGIAAYGAGGLPGIISSYAGQQGVASNIVSDSLTNVYGTTATNENATGTKSAPVGYKRVGRKPVDYQYRLGVAAQISAATSVWALDHNSPGATWQRVGCNPTAAQLSAATQGLYIDCTSSSGITISGSTNATTVFFNGWVKGGGLAMPNAQYVYVNNGADKADGINLSNGDAFCVRSSSCDASAPTSNQCSSTATSSRARVLIRSGDVRQTGGLLKLCNSTVIMLGGQTTTGCVPSTNGSLPTSTPCGGGTGNGQLVVNGGYQDWTAPNEYPGAIPSALQTTAWTNQEDLALWTESYGGASNPAFSMAGGSNTHTVGVFMAPNASPFNITGSGTQNLFNAQYIANSFALNGGATLNMTVDPNNAVTLQTLAGFYLVR
jgi:Flp pilus assembly protein TadG